MRPTEYAYGWEVDGLARRLDTLEERLDRRDRERREREQRRLDHAMLVFWILWGVAIGGTAAVAALN